MRKTGTKKLRISVCKRMTNQKYLEKKNPVF